MQSEITRRLKKAIVLSEGHIAREMEYSEDLRNNETIAFYKKHIVKLNGMMKTHNKLTQV